VTVTRQDFIDAVTAYWGAKEKQLGSSKIADAVGAGTAGSVRGGKHFDAIAALIAKFFVDAGYPPESIRLTKKAGIQLPGYYRPQKDWDVVVVHRDTLVAAFELKALGGPSFSNNYNNRIEEALGSAVCVKRAALEDLYPGEKPWLGYFFIMEDAPGSRKPVKLGKGALPPGSEWHGASYQDRFALFGRRLLAENLYDSVCFIASSAESPDQPNEPQRELDWQHFWAAVNARISYLADLGFPG
jgi:hypothetical protein